MRRDGLCNSAAEGQRPKVQVHRRRSCACGAARICLHRWRYAVPMLTTGPPALPRPTPSGTYASENAPTPKTAGWLRFLVWEGGTRWDAFFTAASAQVGQVILSLPHSLSQTGMVAGGCPPLLLSALHRPSTGRLWTRPACQACAARRAPAWASGQGAPLRHMPGHAGPCRAMPGRSTAALLETARLPYGQELPSVAPPSICPLASQASSCCCCLPPWPAGLSISW